MSGEFQDFDGGKMIKGVKCHFGKFTGISKRWFVERAFAWFESYRRLSKDFEYMADTSEVMIQLAMIRLMLNRIKKIKLKQSLKFLK